ncbi:MAG: inorganic phosphate transporter [Betaproteobacteria bacterium]|uniref:Phosphate transporter n=1 Tax=Candidatus Proximibacter danicus TaxID=2954365 RepID=A0A9D7JZY5_9PROT|nr:inorganic phosphate transporter [Candidatus Proximibacter danicus]
MEFKDIANIEKSTRRGSKESLRLGIGLIFVVAIMLYVSLGIGISGPHGVMLVVAAMIGGYMAMNIGANDVANNVGPAVGSHAISMTGAVIIAAIFEMAGALIAGGDVVTTIQKGIINPAAIASSDQFIWLMTAALLAGALWLNLATAFGAPVSTTHSIIGAVLGAGMAAGGVAAANWGNLVGIAASWVISPVLGGIIAAGFLFWIKRSITYREDMVSAARRMVPLLIGLMAFAFSAYLILKGFSRIWKVGAVSALGIGALIGISTYFLLAKWMSRDASTLENTKKSINRLFTTPLICAAALLSFAHGANDVANAVGPLAAIADAARSGMVSGKATIPFWVMFVGASGIAIGLMLYGPKLIRTVGSEITELDQMRAFCIAMSAAVTVILASQLGLPVSSTHIAVGGVFGVGFLREFIKTSYSQMIEEIKQHHAGADKEVVEDFLNRFEKASLADKRVMLERLKAHAEAADLSKRERKQIRKVYRHELVKRSAIYKIAAAWVITVPVSGALAAVIYYMIVGMVQS